MRILYIDVYFLINFTVDLLSLYFSAAMLKFPIRRLRIVAASAIGACFASAAVLLYGREPLVLVLSVFSLFLMIVLCGKGGGVFRRIRLAVLFLLLQMLIGGIVHWGYRVLEGWIGKFNEGGGVENQKLLYLAVLILASLGVLRISMALLSQSKSEKACEVEIVVEGKRFVGSAFVDSGNLLCDPMDGVSVVLVKESVARKLLPEAFLLENTEALSEPYRKRLRLIPVRVLGAQRILFGIRPDEFSIIINKGRKEHMRVVVAYDKEEGDFGGYAVLIPSAIAENV